MKEQHFIATLNLQQGKLHFPRNNNALSHMPETRDLETRDANDQMNMYNAYSA